MENARILVVEDEPFVAEDVIASIREMGHEVCAHAVTGEEAVERASAESPDLVLMDVFLPGAMDGIDAAGLILGRRDVPIIYMTAYAEADLVARAKVTEPYGFFLKPFNRRQLAIAVEIALYTAEMARRSKRAEGEPAPARRIQGVVRERSRLGDIIGKSEAMQRVYDQILKAAAADVSVVLLGETGAGKDLVAVAIHNMSDRRQEPFVPVNCAAIPETLIESEFFGHRKGAFTGAQFDKQGLLAAAHGGTLLLDEVAELAPNMQAKLLRALDSGEYMPIGGNGPRSSDVRIVAATNRRIEEAVETGRLREDFYYRVNVVQIHLPPLRARKEDIPLLATHFLEMLGGRDAAAAFPGRLMERLYAHHWPGNVRELKGVIQRYLSFGDLDDGTFGAPRKRGGTPGGGEIHPLKQAMDDFEKTHIQKALDRNAGSRRKTAEVLGIDKKTLYRKMVKGGLI